MEQDAEHGVSLLQQVITQGGLAAAKAQGSLALCYMAGDGVEADTRQATLYCKRAIEGGDALAIEMLPDIQRCHLCGTPPAR